MAIVSAATFKTQAAAMAVALTAAWKDSAKTEVAASIRNPHHGLRRVEKFFNFNAATGVVTSDDTYIDACYAGDVPSKGNPFDVVTTVAMVLSTITAETAAATQIVLTFAENIRSASGISVGGDAAPSKTVGEVSISGAVVTINVNTAYESIDTITVSGTFSGESLNSVLLTDEAVTNNIAPVVLSMTVENAAPNDLVVVFNEAITATNLGYALRVDEGARALDAVAGTGTDTLTFTINGAAITNAGVLDLSYDSTTGDSVNGAAIEVVTFLQQAVTNNVA